MGCFETDIGYVNIVGVGGLSPEAEIGKIQYSGGGGDRVGGLRTDIGDIILWEGGWFPVRCGGGGLGTDIGDVNIGGGGGGDRGVLGQILEMLIL